VDAIFYLVDNGIKWRALPKDFPPWSTVYNYFAAWEAAGVTQDVLDGLRDRAGIIDSASVKAAETVAKASRGFDAGKKINGRKRHIAVDTFGLLVCVLVTAANVPDRTAAAICSPACVNAARPSSTCGPIPATPAPCWTGQR
jgi:hypothetical protein